MPFWGTFLSPRYKKIPLIKLVKISKGFLAIFYTK